MKSTILSTVTFFALHIIHTPLFAQFQPAGHGYYNPEAVNCLKESERESIKETLSFAMQNLNLNAVNPFAEVKFIWPVKAADHLTDPCFYGISNFVDHNRMASSNNETVVDYNCGQRTYDTNSGYNHSGTDIFLWPFPWEKFQNNSVEVVAAAAGTIISKMDDNPDQSCGFCSDCNWNAIYLRHDDGSISWYGHLKRESLTSKPVGSRLEQGDYLGLVGSSGNSTGPHLHFEVYSDASMDDLVDPYSGECNGMNGVNSLWEVQKPYREPTLNKILISKLPVEEMECPQPAISNEVEVLQAGDFFFLTLFFHDQLDADQVNIQILQPDGQTSLNIDAGLSGEYNASWWYWELPVFPNAMSGTWKVKVTYYDQVEEHSFQVGLLSSGNQPVLENEHCIVQNPFVQNLFINCQDVASMHSVSLFDLSGKILLQNKQLNHNTQLNLNTGNLQSGIYLLRFTDENGQPINTQRIIKTH